jgi:hypothetical protein
MNPKDPKNKGKEIPERDFLVSFPLRMPDAVPKQSGSFFSLCYPPNIPIPMFQMPPSICFLCFPILSFVTSSPSYSRVFFLSYVFYFSMPNKPSTTENVSIKNHQNAHGKKSIKNING